MTYDILIRNAVTRTSSGKRVDVAIAGGRIARIAPDIKEGAAEVFDAWTRCIPWRRSEWPPFRPTRAVPWAAR